MDVKGYLVSIFIGISLGLIGGGGSILTVPLLIYLFNIETFLATIYSLFIVGITSFIGSMSYLKKGLVNIKTAIFFGIPSIVAVFLTRTYIVPFIPQNIISFENFTVSKSLFLMIFFAVLMIFASYSMIKTNNLAYNEMLNVKPFNYVLIFWKGFFIGIITGLIGAGGGFLIIPALVNVLRLPIKNAVGTSLLIISVNSLAGFLFSLHHTKIDWVFLLKTSSFTILGILIGSFFSTKIDGKNLKPAFGWFVLIIGIYILFKEMIFK